MAKLVIFHLISTESFMFLVKNDKKYPFCYPGISETENKPSSLYNLRFASRGQIGYRSAPVQYKVKCEFRRFL